MPDGKERAADILHGPDGVEVYRQLVRYADLLARIHGWRAGHTLPNGESPQSVTSNVVVKLIDPNGTRTWDDTKEPSLLNALKGMVRSEIGHLYEKAEQNLVEPIHQQLPDGRERTADSFASTDLHPEDLNPEQRLLRKERKQLENAAMTLILREAEGNDDLESVVLALCDTGKPNEIAAITGLPIERVHSVRKELNRRVSRITLARVVRARSESGL